MVRADGALGELVAGCQGCRGGMETDLPAPLGPRRMTLAR
jgi:hypothetical protein